MASRKSQSERMAADLTTTEREVAAVLDASRALVGVAAKSLSPLEDAMSVTQFRALMIIASRGPLHSAALAEAMGIHASNATRACDRLFGDGLINRVEGTTDRRHLMLTLTVRGRRLVDAVTRRRTTAIREILQRIPVQDRRQVAHVFALFADAAGEPREQDLWALGWMTRTEEEPAENTLPAASSKPGSVEQIQSRS
jgi:DNA-binding MarR family transcriptional regulator